MPSRLLYSNVICDINLWRNVWINRPVSSNHKTTDKMSEILSLLCFSCVVLLRISPMPLTFRSGDSLSNPTNQKTSWSDIHKHIHQRVIKRAWVRTNQWKENRSMILKSARYILDNNRKRIQRLTNTDKNYADDPKYTSKAYTRHSVP